MLRNIVHIICLVNVLNKVSAAIQLIEYNETNLLHSMHLRLTELESQRNEGFQLLSEDHQAIKSELKELRELQQKQVEYFKLQLEHQQENKHLKNLIDESCKKLLKSNLLPNLYFQTSGVDSNSRNGWTTILRRLDGSVNFYRNWTEYKNGFGNTNGEFFLGLDKIHNLTTEKRHELLVLLEDFEGVEKFEAYDNFAIGNEAQKYVLHTLGSPSETAGDSFSVHQGHEFTTFDRDNDVYPGLNCAVDCLGAWWYKYCSDSNLTGAYNNTSNKGITWLTFKGRDYSLKSAIMMIRPKM